MEYMIGLDGFISLKEVVQATAHGVWEVRSGSKKKLILSDKDDWFIAERLVVPFRAQVERAAYDVSLHRVSDGTKGDPDHDWLYAELVLAVQAYQKLCFEGFDSALRIIEEHEFRMLMRP